jgi:hypothetical protein
MDRVVPSAQARSALREAPGAVEEFQPLGALHRYPISTTRSTAQCHHSAHANTPPHRVLTHGDVPSELLKTPHATTDRCKEPGVRGHAVTMIREGNGVAHRASDEHARSHRHFRPRLPPFASTVHPEHERQGKGSETLQRGGAGLSRARVSRLYFGSRTSISWPPVRIVPEPEPSRHSKANIDVHTSRTRCAARWATLASRDWSRPRLCRLKNQSFRGRYARDILCYPRSGDTCSTRSQTQGARLTPEFEFITRSCSPRISRPLGRIAPQSTSGL